MNTQSASITGLVGTPNKGFGTGKGTTARIKELFADRQCAYTSEEIAIDLGLPSRQISKRLAELVKSGFFETVTSATGRKAFQRKF